MNINYTLAELKNAHISETTAYTGHITHNRVLTIDDMAERYADRYRCSPQMARLTLANLSDYIRYEIGEGNRLNFEGFSVALKMTGRFALGNEPYDRARNPIRVAMTPTKPLDDAAAKLTPVNVTERVYPMIDSIAHETVNPVDGYERIRLDGTLTTMNANNCKVDPTRPDEGVWLTALDGTVLLKAEVRENTRVTCDVVFPASTLPSGEYFVLIKCRGGQGYPLVSARKKVTVLPVE